MAAAWSLRRYVWLVLLIAALSVRALTPQGYMTMAAANGGIALMPCDGAMPAPTTSGQPMAMPMAGHHDGNHHKQDHGSRADHPCAFAGIAALDMAPPLAIAIPLRRDTAPALAATLAMLPGRGLAAPPPPATGPPALA
ncbi:MAG: hypothetical protein J0I47_00325 [Sphingomonas sp.]|uniref:hypothetical protein n=1 Tax=Sphingomonas sp. TaxID=28214 RepID=UPI001AC444C2|nr:hypothetical protein [Sphingomonas sp.]MBN8806673.1 hypothetical protein [Sphingomonas sp.]